MALCLSPPRPSSSIRDVPRGRLGQLGRKISSVSLAPEGSWEQRLDVKAGSRCWLSHSALLLTLFERFPGRQHYLQQAALSTGAPRIGRRRYRADNRGLYRNQLRNAARYRWYWRVKAALHSDGSRKDWESSLLRNNCSQQLCSTPGCPCSRARRCWPRGRQAGREVGCGTWAPSSLPVWGEVSADHGAAAPGC